MGRGASIAEWIELLTLDHLPLTVVGSSWIVLLGTLDSITRGSYPARLWNIGDATLEPTRA